eukprot:TRINITY_DN10270_c2_g2_i1.p1 TRINITY_DN10270_c2_g2~~TRINITY_DN10270_c2_g2_i1.p1  ORF type:complete len:4220 (+),score=1424.11 TRINITY_DN10270_c2_g2_i1:60-12662(+)
MRRREGVRLPESLRLADPAHTDPGEHPGWASPPGAGSPQSDGTSGPEHLPSPLQLARPQRTESWAVPGITLSRAGGGGAGGPYGAPAIHDVAVPAEEEVDSPGTRTGPLSMGPLSISIPRALSGQVTSPSRASSSVSPRPTPHAEPRAIQQQEIPAGLRALTPPPQLKWRGAADADDPVRDLFICCSQWPPPRRRAGGLERDASFEPQFSGAPFSDNARRVSGGFAESPRLRPSGSSAFEADQLAVPPAPEDVCANQRPTFRALIGQRGETPTALVIYCCAPPTEQGRALAPFVVTHCFVKGSSDGLVRFFICDDEVPPAPPEIPTTNASQMASGGNLQPPSFQRDLLSCEVPIEETGEMGSPPSDGAVGRRPKDAWREFQVTEPRPGRWAIMVVSHERTRQLTKRRRARSRCLGRGKSASVLGLKQQQPVTFYGYAKEWGELTSFSVAHFVVKGKKYSSVEHFFQSMKFEGRPEEDEVRQADTSELARQLGRKYPLREDWDAVKEQVLLVGVRAKFAQNPHLKEKLLSTERCPLHFADAEDSFWGTALKKDGSPGDNRYGLILERVRDELRSGTVPTEYPAGACGARRAGSLFAPAVLQLDGMALAGVDAADWAEGAAAVQGAALPSMAACREKLLTPLYLPALHGDERCLAEGSWVRRLLRAVQHSQRMGGVGHALLQLRLEEQGPAKGSGALHAAARGTTAGHVKILQMLLDAGADTRAVNARMSTPLHCAAKADGAGAVQALLRAQRTLGYGAISESDIRGNTPLMVAIEARKRAAMEALLSASPHMVRDQLRYTRRQDGATAMHLACRRLDTTAVKALLRAAVRSAAPGRDPLGATVNTEPRGGVLGRRKSTFLSEAQTNDAAEELEEGALEALADEVTTRTSQGDTPLMCALRAARLKLAIPNPRRDSAGSAAALPPTRSDTADRALDLSGSAPAVASGGAADYRAAVAKVDTRVVELVRMLLDLRADPGAATPEGESVLHLAAACGSLRALRAVLHVTGVEDDCHCGARVFNDGVHGGGTQFLYCSAGASPRATPSAMHLENGREVKIQDPARTVMDCPASVEERMVPVIIDTPTKSLSGFVAGSDIRVPQDVIDLWNLLDAKTTVPVSATPLMYAARHAQIGALEILLKATLRYQGIQQLDISGATAKRELETDLGEAMRLAAEEGHTHVLRAFERMLRDQQVRHADLDMSRALLHSCKEGNLPMATYLLDHCQDPELLLCRGPAAEGRGPSDEFGGASALHVAAARGRNEIVELLLSRAQNKVDEGRITLQQAQLWLCTKCQDCTPLTAALKAREGDRPGTVMELLEFAISCDVDIMRQVDAAAGTEEWVHLAGAHAGTQVPVVSVGRGPDGRSRVLLPNGDTLPVADERGRIVLARKTTPLHAAVLTGNARLLELLVEHHAQIAQQGGEGADEVQALEALNAEGLTPLLLAVQHRQQRMVEILLNPDAHEDLRPADPRAQTPAQETAVHLLARWKPDDSPAAVDAILEQLGAGLRRHARVQPPDDGGPERDDSIFAQRTHTGDSQPRLPRIGSVTQHPRLRLARSPSPTVLSRPPSMDDAAFVTGLDSPKAVDQLAEGQELAEFLLKRSAQGQTPLELACGQGATRVVRWVLQQYQGAASARALRARVDDDYCRSFRAAAARICSDSGSGFSWPAPQKSPGWFASHRSAGGTRRFAAAVITMLSFGVPIPASLLDEAAASPSDYDLRAHVQPLTTLFTHLFELQAEHFDGQAGGTVRRRLLVPLRKTLSGDATVPRHLVVIAASLALQAVRREAQGEPDPGHLHAPDEQQFPGLHFREVTFRSNCHREVLAGFESGAHKRNPPQITMDLVRTQCGVQVVARASTLASGEKVHLRIMTAGLGRLGTLIVPHDEDPHCRPPPGASASGLPAAGHSEEPGHGYVPITLCGPAKHLFVFLSPVSMEDDVVDQTARELLDSTNVHTLQYRWDDEEQWSQLRRASEVHSAVEWGAFYEETTTLPQLLKAPFSCLDMDVFFGCLSRAGPHTAEGSSGRGGQSFALTTGPGWEWTGPQRQVTPQMAELLAQVLIDYLWFSVVAAGVRLGELDIRGVQLFGGYSDIFQSWFTGSRLLEGPFSELRTLHFSTPEHGTVAVTHSCNEWTTGCRSASRCLRPLGALAGPSFALDMKFVSCTSADRAGTNAALAPEGGEPQEPGSTGPSPRRSSEQVLEAQVRAAELTLSEVVSLEEFCIDLRAEHETLLRCGFTTGGGLWAQIKGARDEDLLKCGIDRKKISKVRKRAEECSHLQATLNRHNYEEMLNYRGKCDREREKCKMVVEAVLRRQDANYALDMLATNGRGLVLNLQKFNASGGPGFRIEHQQELTEFIGRHESVHTLRFANLNFTEKRSSETTGALRSFLTGRIMEGLPCKVIDFGTDNVHVGEIYLTAATFGGDAGDFTGEGSSDHEVEGAVGSDTPKSGAPLHPLPHRRPSAPHLLATSVREAREGTGAELRTPQTRTLLPLGVGSRDSRVPFTPLSQRGGNLIEGVNEAQSEEGSHVSDFGEPAAASGHRRNMAGRADAHTPVKYFMLEGVCFPQCKCLRRYPIHSLVHVVHKRRAKCDADAARGSSASHPYNVYRRARNILVRSIQCINSSHPCHFMRFAGVKRHGITALRYAIHLGLDFVVDAMVGSKKSGSTMPGLLRRNIRYDKERVEFTHFVDLWGCRTRDPEGLLPLHAAILQVSVCGESGQKGLRELYTTDHQGEAQRRERGGGSAAVRDGGRDGGNVRRFGKTSADLRRGQATAPSNLLSGLGASCTHTTGTSHQETQEAQHGAAVAAAEAPGLAYSPRSASGAAHPASSPRLQQHSPPAGVPSLSPPSGSPPASGLAPQQSLTPPRSPDSWSRPRSPGRPRSPDGVGPREKARVARGPVAGFLSLEPHAGAATPAAPAPAISPPPSSGQTPSPSPPAESSPALAAFRRDSAPQEGAVRVGMKLFTMAKRKINQAQTTSKAFTETLGTDQMQDLHCFSETMRSLEFHEAELDKELEGVALLDALRCVPVDALHDEKPTEEAENAQCIARNLAECSFVERSVTVADHPLQRGPHAQPQHFQLPPIDDLPDRSLFRDVEHHGSLQSVELSAVWDRTGVNEPVLPPRSKEAVTLHMGRNTPDGLGASAGLVLRGTQVVEVRDGLAKSEGVGVGWVVTAVNAVAVNSETEMQAAYEAAQQARKSLSMELAPCDEATTLLLAFKYAPQLVDHFLRSEWADCLVLRTSNALGAAWKGVLLQYRKRFRYNELAGCIGEVKWDEMDMGMNVAHWAPLRGHRQVLQMCLAEHAEAVHARTEQLQWTPLHAAAYAGSPECVNTILTFLTETERVELDADVNKRDCYGNTALHIAASLCHAVCTESLLRAGAKPHWKNLPKAGRVDAHDVAVALLLHHREDSTQSAYKKQKDQKGWQQADQLLEEQVTMLNRNGRIRRKLSVQALKGFLWQASFYLLFLGVLCTVVQNKTNLFSSSHYYAISGIQSKVIGDEFPDLPIKKTLSDVGSTEEMWQYIRGPFYSTLFQPPGDIGANDETGGHLFDVLQVVGTVRMRQLRVRADSCGMDWGRYHGFYLSSHGEHTCFGPWSDGNEETYPPDRKYVINITKGDMAGTQLVADYTDGEAQPEDSWRSSTWQWYPQRGFHIDFPTYANQTQAVSRTLRAMQDNGWVDAQTRVVALDFTWYNMNTGRFIVGSVLFELPEFGGCQVSYRLDYVALEVCILGWNTEERCRSVLDKIVFVLEILLICFVALLTLEEFTDMWGSYTELVQNWREEREHDRKDELEERQQQASGRPDEPPEAQVCCAQRCGGLTVYSVAGFALDCVVHYLLREWNLVDLLNVVLFWVALAYRAFFIKAAEKLKPEELLSDHSHFRDFGVVAAYTRKERDVWALLLLVSFVKLLKYVMILPNVGPVAAAITSTVGNNKTMIFFVVFLIVSLALMMAIHLTLGATTAEWKSFGESTFTFLQIVFGQWDMAPFVRSSWFMGPALFLCTLFLANLVLMNVFIAVVGNIYDENLQMSEESWSWQIIESYQYELTHKPRPTTTGNPIISLGRLLRGCLKRRSGVRVGPSDGGEQFEPLPSRVVRRGTIDRILRSRKRVQTNLADVGEDVCAVRRSMAVLQAAVGRIQLQLDTVTGAVRHIEERQRDAAQARRVSGGASPAPVAIGAVPGVRRPARPRRGSHPSSNTSAAGRWNPP